MTAPALHSVDVPQVEIQQVEVLELAAWGLDENRYRPLVPAQAAAPHRQPPSGAAILPTSTALLAPHLPPILARPDLATEFAGLRWSITVLDLRALHAFQRRLLLKPLRTAHAIPDPDDTLALLDLAFPPPRSIAHRRPNPTTVQSANPDLTLRPTSTGFELYGGSPFFEAARLSTPTGDRFFLRDGYHRAHRLLRAGIYAVPAILIEATSLAGIFPAAPWFFSEDVLMAPNAPLLTDFLNPALTLRYPRPRLLKTITITETFESAPQEFHS